MLIPCSIKKLVLNLQTSAEQLQLKGIAEVDETQQIKFSNVEGALPLSLLEPWFPLVVKGDMAFVIDQVVANPKGLIELDGIVNLEYVDWLGGDQPMPLGSYLAQLSLAENRDVFIQLNDLGAALGIDGFLQFSLFGRYHFKAQLQPRAGLAPEVATSISWLGKQDGQGNVLIDTKGNF